MVHWTARVFVFKGLRSHTPTQKFQDVGHEVPIGSVVVPLVVYM